MNKIKLIKLESGGKYQRLVSRELGSLGIKAGHIILKPGENVKEHNTDKCEEILVVLKGCGELVLEKRKNLKFGKDNVLYIPPETKHDVRNIGSGLLEYIFITSKREAGLSDVKKRL